MCLKANEKLKTAIYFSLGMLSLIFISNSIIDYVPQYVLVILKMGKWVNVSILLISVLLSNDYSFIILILNSLKGRKELHGKQTTSCVENDILFIRFKMKNRNVNHMILNYQDYSYMI